MMETQKKIEEIIAVMSYKSGPGLLNTVYVGGMAGASVIRILGGSYGKDRVADLVKVASDEQIDKAHKALESTIKYMKNNPVTDCPHCGQIMSVKS